MKAWKIGFVVLLFLALLWTFAFSISRSVAKVTLEKVSKETDKITKAQGNLKGEVARLRSAITDLRKAVKLLYRAVEENKRAIDKKSATRAGDTERKGESPKDKPQEETSLLRDLDSIKPLSQKEKDFLQRFRGKLRGLSLGYLLHADLEGILSDPKCNPEGRELTQEELRELMTALRDYTFFEHRAAMLIQRKIIRPEMEKLREEGAYVEYGVGETPPAVEGVSISVGEPAGDWKSFRLFYFYPEDYPDLYELEEARKARAELAALRAYLILNPEKSENPK